MPSKPFRIEPHTTADKSFNIVGPDEFCLKVDFDDVDHKTQNFNARKAVAILNEYWDNFY